MSQAASTRSLGQLGKVFLAYPSEEGTADGMRRLAEELRAEGAQITTWQQLTNPGFVFTPIRGAIDDADAVLAETTFGNPNVLFELGYAIAKGKTVLQLENENAARPRRLYPLEIVRSIRYSDRRAILDFLSEVDLSGPSLFEQLGLDISRGIRGGLYFVPSRRGGDVNETIKRLCEESPFTPRMIDMHDTDYDSLTSQANSIAEADLFVALLVSEDTKEHWDNNAQSMLFAGLAVGMEKDFVVLIQKPMRRLLDLGEDVIAFDSESEAEFRFRQWLGRTAAERLRSPRPPSSVIEAPSSPLAGLFLGSLDARADFDLSSYFIETPEFRQAEAGQRHLFVGSKGSGKTANFELLQERFEGRNQVVISVAPADFEFPRLAAVFDEHLAFAHWEFVYGSFWRFVFITEILRVIRMRFLDHLLRESGSGKTYARNLVKWIDENDALLSLDLVSRVAALLSDMTTVAGDDQAKRAALEQMLQAARMYDVERQLKEFGRQFQIRLLIDDLDRNWSPISDSANRLIVALLNEIQQLMTNQAPNLMASVFIRKDVFSWLRDNDPEVLKRDPGFLAWSSESLKVLIASRIRRHTKSSETDPQPLWNLIFPKFTRGERTDDFIISRTLHRPRDVIQFCQKAVEAAQRAGRPTVDEDDVYEAWEPHGELMLAQIETEYQHRYPGLGEVALAFLEAPAVQPLNEASPAIQRQAAKCSAGEPWLQRAGDDPRYFIEVFYETGIVGVDTPGGSRWFQSERPFSDISAALPEDFRIVVHPAFHRYFRCLME